MEETKRREYTKENERVIDPENESRSGDRDRESDDEEGDQDLDRSERFVETDDKPEVFKSKSLNNLKPFYNGLILDSRMTEIRKSIYYIRQNWQMFALFMTSAKQLLLEDGRIDFKDETTRLHAENLFASRRDWLTQESVQTGELSYEAVKLYTSKEGHSRIYRVCNNLFRQEDSLVSVDNIRSVVFLVELINIDLYNYCLKHPCKRNFQGVVYRGLCLMEDDYAAFRTLVGEPVERRNIAVPLGLFSSSSRLSVARKFIRHQMKNKKPGVNAKPLIMKVHVIGLNEEYIDYYHKSFPSTQLTTICAVDIHELSRHPSEREVLLRGPFMQILQFYEDENEILGRPCNVLEAVMLNANRDHISTSHLGDLDSSAREMFAAMVAVTRNEFAWKYCQEKGLENDVIKYRDALQSSKTKLKLFMK